MVSPISHSTAIHQADAPANAVQKPAAQNQPAKSQPARPQDTVSLKNKNTRDVDHDGDSK